MFSRVNVWICYGLTLATLQGCGGCEDDPVPPARTSTDSGSDEGGSDRDSDLPPGPIDLPDANIPPGDPPEELADERCAADTNKVYEVSSSMGNALPAQLAVDILSSHFAMTFTSAEGATCSNAIQFAEIYGAPGLRDPDVQTAYDGCTLIERAAITRGDDAWLMAIVDNREETRDLWVHAYDSEEVETLDTYRITENDASEEAIAIASLDTERAMIAWTETAFDGTGTSLHVRLLSSTGEPTGEDVVLEEAGTAVFANLSIARLGEFFIGLTYRRDEGGGNAALVFDVLDGETGERDRDPWVLTNTPGDPGSIDLAADDLAGGIVYTVADGESRTVWFQTLDANGYAQPVMGMFGMIGGPSEAHRIVSNPKRGIDVSLAMLRSGFVVAYRALPSTGVEVPQVRAAFLNRVGGIVYDDSAVALASMVGGQTAIETAYDGRVVLTWTDTDDEGNSVLRTLILPCQ